METLHFCVGFLRCCDERHFGVLCVLYGKGCWDSSLCLSWSHVVVALPILHRISRSYSKQRKLDKVLKSWVLDDYGPEFTMYEPWCRQEMTHAESPLFSPLAEDGHSISTLGLL